VQAPVLYLKTWQAKAYDMDLETHTKWRPTVADIREFIAAEEEQ